MINLSSAKLFCILSLFCEWHVVEAKSSKNPCHPREVRHDATTCEVVTLPPGLCRACPIGAFYRSGELQGHFVNCASIMDIESNPECLSLLETYAENNPCDTPRAQAITEFNSTDPTIKETGRMRLDHFVYTFCENGCDCMPKFETKRDDRVLDVHRPNCQGHAYWDLCPVFPDIKLVLSDGDETVHEDDLREMPRVCDLVNEWHAGPAGDKPWEKTNTTVHDGVKLFFENLAQSTGILEDEIFWNDCFDLELTQHRISDLPMPAITGVEVWDSETYTYIQDLVDGQVLNTGNMGSDISIDIRALANAQTAYVRFGLDSNEEFSTDWGEPWFLFQGQPARMEAGNHTIQVTPISPALGIW